MKNKKKKRKNTAKKHCPQNQKSLLSEETRIMEMKGKKTSNRARTCPCASGCQQWLQPPEQTVGGNAGGLSFLLEIWQPDS